MKGNQMSATEKAREFCKLAKQYNAYSTHAGIVEKTFNRGKGSLAIYRFGLGNKVSANKLIERASDRRRLMRFMPDAVLINQSLEYPEWYGKSLPSPD